MTHRETLSLIFRQPKLNTQHSWEWSETNIRRFYGVPKDFVKRSGGMMNEPKSYFVWKIKDVVIEKEDSHNVTYCWIQQKKLRLAVEHGCAYDEVVMVWKEEENEAIKANDHEKEES